MSAMHAPASTAHVFRDDRRGSVMAAVLGMGVLLSVFGSLGFVQVRATRSIAERVRAQIQIDDLGRSAVEEACAVLEETLEPPLVDQATTRDLARVIRWPATVAVPAAQADGRAAGAIVAAVSVRTSGWVFERVTPAPGFEIAREIGVVELSVKVRCGQHERTVFVRRYASTIRRPGESRLRVRIASEDLYLGVEA